MKTNVKGFLIERDGRSLFVRDRDEADWAIQDPEYAVTRLVPEEDASVPPDFEEFKRLTTDLYDLQQSEISQLKTSLGEAVELIENIYEFSRKSTNNTLESKGLLMLIAEGCKKFLAPSDDENIE